VAEDVAPAEPEHDVVAAEEAVGEEGAEQRREVDDADEGLVAGDGLAPREEEVLHHVDGQDRRHPVVGEALAPLVPGEVADLRREAVLGIASHGRRCCHARARTSYGPTG
jgi:hypothetical protein